MSGSLRLLRVSQGDIDHHYNRPHNHGSPPDLQSNYVGTLWVNWSLAF
jgi:hypothetical protein